MSHRFYLSNHLYPVTSEQVWDLTAGKLLNEFKFHEGHIRSIDFHPLEFLLATGECDSVGVSEFFIVTFAFFCIACHCQIGKN